MQPNPYESPVIETLPPAVAGPRQDHLFGWSEVVLCATVVGYLSASVLHFNFTAFPVDGPSLIFVEILGFLGTALTILVTFVRAIVLAVGNYRKLLLVNIAICMFAIISIVLGPILGPFYAQ